MSSSRTGYALGQLNPVIYFQNSRGEIALPPSTEDAKRIKDRMESRGWMWREADTLDKVDRLQTLMQNQSRQAAERNLQREENMYALARKSIRDRLVSRMVSSSTSPYEREFIQHYLMLHESKREEYRKKFMQDQCYFEAREFDSNRKHLEDAVNNVPEMRDESCIRCHNFRRLPNLKICGRCANEVRMNG